MRLIGFLEEALPYVHIWTPTQINSGGCAVFADLLTDKFDELGIKYKIQCIYYKKDPEDTTRYRNMRNLLNNRPCDVKQATAAHILVQLGEYLFIDSTGIINASLLIDEKYLLEINKEVLKSIRDIADWNPVFDRTCIPGIKDRLDKVFKHINDFYHGMFKFPKRDEVKLTKYTVEQRSTQDRNIFSLLLR